MAVNRHFFLVSFDISKDKIRYRVVKVLLKFGTRVQKSVFECLLNDKQYLEMKSALDKLIERDTDSIRYYHLCQNCVKTIEITGKGFWNLVEEVIVV